MYDYLYVFMRMLKATEKQGGQREKERIVIRENVRLAFPEMEGLETKDDLAKFGESPPKNMPVEEVKARVEVIREGMVKLGELYKKDPLDVSTYNDPLQKIKKTCPRSMWELSERTRRVAEMTYPYA